MTHRLLLAEDDRGLRRVMETVLMDAGFNVTLAEDGAKALALYEQAAAEGAAPELIVTDINMPELDGLALLDRLKAHDPEALVICVTAYGSLDSAVAALRKGAYDYLTKPFRNDRLVAVCKNALRQRELFRENRVLRRAVEQSRSQQGILGTSPAMDGALRLVERAGPSSASILIHGETGSGKEVFARAIHRSSPRADGPFVALNCGALPEGLLESELFGHEKGAFSGAIKSSQGLLRSAHGGTLFLDEVGEMAPALQVKLLRVLETREVRPVGATKSTAVDVRVLAATHRDLQAAMESGEFRDDLYYRLAVIELEVPPLRARGEDIALLAAHFLKLCAQERSEGEQRLSPEAVAVLEGYPWPGNVRELRNAMEHASVIGSESLGVEDLPPRIRRGSKLRPAPGGAVLVEGRPVKLAELERRHVEGVLQANGGDRRKAAELLGIDLSTLYRKLKRWQGSPEETAD